MNSAALFALFLLSAFTSYLPSATAAVTDMYGNVVRNGGKFYILPVLRGSGGGITRTATGNETCPLTVVQSRSEINKGLPLTITSIFRSGFIPEGSRVFIEFTSVPPCAPTPSEWTLVEGLPEGLAVKITGYENTVKGGFYIHSGSSDNSYKLLFCPPLENSGCGAIGIVRDDRKNRHLAVTENKPFEFVLQEIVSSTAST